MSLFDQALAATGGFPAVDTIVLGEDVMPGQWLLMPTGQPFDWNKQKGWGLNGASLLFAGEDLTDVTFLVRFWSAKDWVAFQPLRKKYLSRSALQIAAQKTYALSIVHPELNAIGVTSVVVKKNPVFTNNGKGLWFANVEFIQYRKAVAAQESPQATIPAAGPIVLSAQEAFDQERALHAAEAAAR